MRKLITASMLLILGLACGVNADSAHPSFQASQPTWQNLPNTFFIEQRWASLTQGFDICSQDRIFGTVFRRFFSLTPQYDYYDTKENLVATGRMRIFSFGAIFDITDANDQPIGSVEERIFSFFPTFQIFTPDDRRVAVASMNFWGTTYTLYHPVTNQQIGSLWRPFFRFKDNWTLTIDDPHTYSTLGVDPRLFIILAAFQTDSDEWRRRCREDNNNHFDFSLLDGYRNDFENCDFDESDLIAVENLTEQQVLAPIANDSSLDDKEKFTLGIQSLLTTFEDEQVPQRQKAALYHMMKSRLSKGQAE